MNKLILTTITTILILNMMGCATQSSNDNVTSSESQIKQIAGATQETDNLTIYDETATGIPIKTQYPPKMEVSAIASGEGVGVFFKFKPQNNALDQAEVHFFLPRGAKTATEIESFVTDTNGLIANNGWILVPEATPPQDLLYPWVKKIMTFSTAQEMMGHILFGETNNQAVQVILIYPAQMSQNYWSEAKIVLDNAEFVASLLPINGDEEPSSDHSMYQSLPLPETNKLVGDDPQQITLELFGVSEPVEGNFQEEVSLVEQTDSKAIVILTQTGLADDSVEGTRYWLEFIRQGQKWQLNWTGRQVRCYPDRGSQTWSTNSCI
jgi:hypothetical protein